MVLTSRMCKSCDGGNNGQVGIYAEHTQCESFELLKMVAGPWISRICKPCESEEEVDGDLRINFRFLDFITSEWNWRWEGWNCECLESC